VNRATCDVSTGRSSTPAPPGPSSGTVHSSYTRAKIGGYRLTWTAPRTKGVEIRVYGVTRGFRTDDAEGECVWKGTDLPNDVRVLVAKGPASKGVLDLDIVGIVGGDQAEDGCTWFDQTEDGTRFYSIVVAVYATNGRSSFAIADPGGHSPGECGVDTY
jgi:hypothetical protein